VSRWQLQAEKKILGIHATDDQRTRLINQTNALRQRIDVWSAVQALYMPHVALLRATEQLGNTVQSSNVDSDLDRVANTPLHLPSAICESKPCESKLMEIEWDLWYAQASDALNECRHYVQFRTQFLKFKDSNLRGQGANTRARRTVQSIEERLALSHAKYNVAHGALTTLGHRLGKTGWQHKLQPLKANDLRAMGDILWGETTGTSIMSWIWLSHGLPADDDITLQDSKCAVRIFIVTK
jgi:hypothetical protein